MVVMGGGDGWVGFVKYLGNQASQFFGEKLKSLLAEGETRDKLSFQV